MEPWKAITLIDGETRLWELGEMRVWLRARVGELAAAICREGECGVQGKELPEDLEWKRWTGLESVDRVKMVPVHANRPLVLKPASQVTVSPGRKVQLYAALPLHVTMLLDQEPPVELWTEPTQILSNTWFGDTYSGELCYGVHWIEALTLDDLPKHPNRIICPVGIRNASKGVLTVQRFCVRVEHLRLYQGDERLWSNGVAVTYAGDEKISDVKYDTAPPKEGSNLKLLQEAEVAPSRGNRKRSFFDPGQLKQYL